jgi:thioesterase domain-containing protein
MDMQAIQPEGPYFLGGFCSGGTIAFEMAQQLRAQGHEVAMLALLDARRVVRQPRSRLGRRVLIHVGNVLRLSVSDKLEYLLDKVRGVTHTAKHSIKTRGEAPSARDILDRVIDCAEREYVPQIYPGRMILFRPGEQPAEYYLDPYLGWEGLAAGGIEVRDIPTGSGTMFREPHVQTLARELRASMEAGKNARLSAGRDEVLRSGQRA